jgi:hypothetical protein
MGWQPEMPPLTSIAGFFYLFYHLIFIRFAHNINSYNTSKMEFAIKDLKESASGLSRRIGYIIIDTNEKKEYNMVRRLDRDNYPRFHIYLSQQGSNFIFSLHLDQKKPVYEGSGAHAHNGEYFGPIIDGEADRIKSVLSVKKTNDQEIHGSGWEN